MIPFAAVLWDLDGTFIDSEPVHLLALGEALARLGVAPTPELQGALMGSSAREVHAYCVEHCSLTASFAELASLKHEAYARRAAALRPRPEATSLFRWLEERGVPQAIVSNSDRIIVDLNLRALDLAIPELVTVSRNDVHEGKPDPEAFLRAAHLLRVPPRACVVVEDSPVGAAAGLAAGMRVIVWADGTFPGDCLLEGVTSARDGLELARLLEREEEPLRPVPRGLRTCPMALHESSASVADRGPRPGPPPWSTGRVRRDAWGPRA